MYFTSSQRLLHRTPIQASLSCLGRGQKCYLPSAGGPHLWPTPDEDVCTRIPRPGLQDKALADCAINSTISSHSHLSQFTSIEVGLMNIVSRNSVPPRPEQHEYTRRASIIEETFREMDVSVRMCTTCWSYSSLRYILHGWSIHVHMAFS